jgi:hypothetical protein
MNAPYSTTVISLSSSDPHSRIGWRRSARAQSW